MLVRAPQEPAAAQALQHLLDGLAGSALQSVTLQVVFGKTAANPTKGCSAAVGGERRRR